MGFEGYSLFYWGGVRWFLGSELVGHSYMLLMGYQRVPSLLIACPNRMTKGYDFTNYVFIERLIA